MPPSIWLICSWKEDACSSSSFAAVFFFFLFFFFLGASTGGAVGGAADGAGGVGGAGGPGGPGGSEPAMLEPGSIVLGVCAGVKKVVAFELSDVGGGLSGRIVELLCSDPTSTSSTLAYCHQAKFVSHWDSTEFM